MNDTAKIKVIHFNAVYDTPPSTRWKLSPDIYHIFIEYTDDKGKQREVPTYWEEEHHADQVAHVAGLLATDFRKEYGIALKWDKQIIEGGELNRSLKHRDKRQETTLD